MGDDRGGRELLRFWDGEVRLRSVVDDDVGGEEVLRSLLSSPMNSVVSPSLLLCDDDVGGNKERRSDRSVLWSTRWLLVLPVVA